jgi:hypothetical protein
MSEQGMERLTALVLKVQESGIQVLGAEGWEDNLISFVEMAVKDKLDKVSQTPLPDYEPGDGEPAQFCRVCGGSGSGFSKTGDCLCCKGTGLVK